MDDGGLAKDNWTVLDKFAKGALCGLLSGEEPPDRAGGHAFKSDKMPDYIGRAYGLAKMMLAEKRRIEEAEHDSRERDGATATEGAPAG